MPKTRLDVLVAQRGLAESREQAQRLIGSGLLLVNGTPATKSGYRYADDIRLEVKSRPRYVSRGGEKLEKAFEVFGLNVVDCLCLDIGASTGGFTDCLLQHGASRVFAVDVGKGQLHWKLRNDPRVTVLEGVNARRLSPSDIDGIPSLAVVDVSFISLTKILPAVIRVLAPEAKLVTLIKPQFEAGREQVGRGGVVKDAAVHREVIDRIRVFGTREQGLSWLDSCASPLRGPAGNIEFLAHWRKS